MPSSVSEGTRPSAARMRSYSSAVMLCWASNCGVTATGSGTTAEEAVVITVASIVARDSHRNVDGTVWKAPAMIHTRKKEEGLRYTGSAPKDAIY